MADSACLPLISWHQFEELLTHRDAHLVDARVRFLRSLPLVAWIAPSRPDAGPGSVLDIFSAEVKAALAEPTCDPTRVRDRAKEGLIRVGAGSDAIPDIFLDWRVLREVFQDRAARAREIVAISRSTFVDMGRVRIADLMRQPLREPADTHAQLARLRTTLATDIVERGDRRIPDPGAVAIEFVSGLDLDRDALTADGRHPAVNILLSQGLELDDIGPETTVGQAGTLSIFLTRLRQVSELEGLTFLQVKKVVTMDRLPVTLIENGMRDNAQDVAERKGSDLNDVNLLCLSPYADLTFVDKRTLENLLRARRKCPSLSTFTGNVRKASNLHQIEKIILSMS